MNPPLGENILQRFVPHAALLMQEAIAETGGREVFFAGSLDAQGRVAEVRVCARGHASAVPALFEGLKIRDVVIHNHPSGDLSPSEADLELASVYVAQGHGVYIVDNDVTRVYVVVEPFLPEQMQPLVREELDALFGAQGGMARTLPQFEARPQQVKMMEVVAEAFNREGIAVIEAPTGVGKTMAYLLPAAMWALRNKERVVISTRTINLQEQIVFKDIPLLRRALGENVECCLVKGRSNYVCLRKLERALSEATLFDDAQTQAQLKGLAEWVDRTEDGSKSDLPFVPERELWERVCSEADTCNVGRCPNPKKCFVGRARRNMAKSDLIVANHHMLFSDVAIKREAGDFSTLGVLPSYRRVIFDEAHSIEDSATEYLGVNATLAGMLSAMNRLYRIERGRERGVIPLLKYKLMKECPQLSVSDYELMLRNIDENFLPALAIARDRLVQAFGALRELAAAKCGQIGRDIKWRLTQNVLLDPDLRHVHVVEVMPAVEAVRELIKFGQALQRRLDAIEPGPQQQESPVVSDLLQLKAYLGRLESMNNALEESTSEELEKNTVRWIEIDARHDGTVRVARCPLHVGQPLAESLYDNLKTVVMTSATLTVEQNFHYLFSRLGINLVDSRRVEAISLDSPFDYEEQALLAITSDNLNPTDPGFQDETVECLKLALEITRGHAFILFTSFSALEHAYRRLANGLRAQGITPLQQGEAARTQLLERFRSTPSSVLFGTDSFWEGVDVAGDALQCVILPKLPFRVPTEPILEARAEAIEAEGGNAFMDYSVPQAVIKFRQGFGRLIRRRSDRGAVLVLDRRILTKRYGRAFLNSLPPIRISRGPKRGVFLALSEFFKGGDDNGRHPH